MEKVLLHCPLNISRTMSQMMAVFCGKLSQKYGLAVQLETQPHRPEEKSLLKSAIEKGRIPALTVGHVDDFADLPADALSQFCRSLPGRFPLREALARIGLGDSEGYLHPFAVVPFAMFYNRNLLDENQIPASWRDLLNPCWQNKILMPDPFRIVSAVIRAFLRTDFPEAFDAHFAKNIIQQGSPPEVVAAVDEGIYPIGITNIAFARISRRKNTRIIWPEDGLFCMPQVMVFGWNAPAPILEIGDYLMSHEVQAYLSMQSFVPASPEAALHPLVAENDCNLRWKGWASFLSVVRERRV